MRRSLLLAGLALAVMNCGDSSGPPSANRVAEVMILRSGSEADSVYHVDYLGRFDLTAIALNSARQELPGTSYTISWFSSDATVASVSSGHVNVSKDGSTWIIARSADFSDSVRIAVIQTASRAKARQDTVVALTPGATKLSGQAIDNVRQLPDTVRFEVFITDAAGTEASSADAITYTNVTPSLFTIVPNAKGDSVKIIGITPGSGKIALHFLSFVDTIHVQVVSSYAVVTINQGLGQTIVNPTNVSVPTGSAVLFQNILDGGSFLVLGTGWRVGPIPSRLREANVFTTAGTFPFTVGSATASVTVTP